MTPLPPPHVADPDVRRRQRRWNRLELWLAMAVGLVAAIFLYAR